VPKIGKFPKKAQNTHSFERKTAKKRVNFTKNGIPGGIPFFYVVLQRFLYSMSENHLRLFFDIEYFFFY